MDCSGDGENGSFPAKTVNRFFDLASHTSKKRRLLLAQILHLQEPWWMLLYVYVYVMLSTLTEKNKIACISKWRNY